MKYTPQQLLDFIHEKNYEIDVHNAMFNNGLGFHLFILNEDSIIEKEDGYYVRIDTDLGETEDIAIILPEEDQKSLDNLKNHREDSIAAITMLQVEDADPLYYYTIGSKHTKEDILHFFDQLMLDFIEFLQVDTRGKLLKVLKDGYVLYKHWFGEEDPCELLSQSLGEAEQASYYNHMYNLSLSEQFS